MLRGQATTVGPTKAALNPLSTRQALQARNGAIQKSGGNTFTGVPTVAVKKVVIVGGR